MRVRSVELVLLAAMSCLGCKRDSGTTADRTSPAAQPTVPPRPPEFRVPTAEQLARKARSEALLHAANVEVPSSLPVIAGESDAAMRKKDEVVDRAIALLVVAVKGEGLEQPIVDTIRSHYGADAFFSPKEKAFVLDVAPSPQARSEFGWKYECLGVLHWALGFVDALGPPSTVVDAGQMVKLVRDRGVPAYRDGAHLRPPATILDEADLIYRYSWACVDARVNGKAAPTGVNCDVVIERHRALSWLYGYQGQAWDDVSTDT